MKFVWTSDTHLGLKTDELDRNPEIKKVLKTVIRYAVRKKADGIILGGDIFDHNNPSEELMGMLIDVLNQAKDIMIYIMAGNHETIARSKRRSCLSLIRKISKRYKNLKLIDDITTFKVPGKLDHCYFTFLPFIEKPHIPPKYKTTQEYINKKSLAIQNKLPKDAQHIVFSHLGVPGAIPGSEQHLLKKVDLMVPDVFLNNGVHVVNGHVHCFDKETEVLTRKGWKFFNDLTFDDRVATLNTDSLFLEFQKPKEIISTQYSGEKIQIKNRKIDLLVTPNHRMLGRKYNGKLVFYEASHHSGKIDYFKTAINKRVGLDLKDCELRLLVNIVADGSFENNQIRFHLKKVRKIRNLEKLLKKNKIKYRLVNTGETVRLSFFKKDVFNFEKFFPNHIKILPKLFRKLSHRQVNIILDEYAITDGNYFTGRGIIDRDIIQIATGKKYEADLIQELCAVSGISCNLNIRRVENREYYYLFINRKINTCSVSNCDRRSNFKTRKYKGEVGCVSVKNETVLVRRNGKTCITGNSRGRYGNVRVIGSPIFGDFGEKEKYKYFLEINIDEIPFPPDGKYIKFKYIKSPCKKFLEFNLNKPEPIWEEFEITKDMILKINVDGTEEILTHDWEKFHKDLSQHCYYVKPINPNVKRKRIKRNKKQKVGLSAKESVDVWLKNNKTKNSKLIRKKAYEIIDSI